MVWYICLLRCNGHYVLETVMYAIFGVTRDWTFSVVQV